MTLIPLEIASLIAARKIPRVDRRFPTEQHNSAFVKIR
jgi:hypothetical protein